jgi:hypothetical protein
MGKLMSCICIVATTCCGLLAGEPPFKPGNPTAETPVGLLGYRIGTYLTIEGIRAEEGKVGVSTLLVDKVGDYKLKEPVAIWVEGLELRPKQRCVLKGYEGGSWIGVPESVLRATGSPEPHAMWQFYIHFVVTSIDEPKGPPAAHDKPRSQPRPGVANNVEPLIPASLNALLPKITPGMTPDNVKKVLAVAYPKLERYDGPWAGQGGYIGFKLDERYSVLFFARMDAE